MSIFHEIYEYRQMIASLVKKDLKGRYKGSVLGFLWTFINPLLQLLVYTFVFSTILQSGIPQYYLHLFVALVPWIFFSSSLTTGSQIILGQKNMIKKIYFPREVMPIAYATSSFVNMLLSFLVIFAVLLVSGKGVSLSAILWLPAVMLIQYLLVLGVTFLTSSLTVYLRDLEHIMGVLQMALMYLSPVVYSLDRIPEQWRTLYLCNPMAPILVSYRNILYYKIPPEGGELLLALGLSLAVLLIGWLTFGKLKKHFAEEL